MICKRYTYEVQLITLGLQARLQHIPRRRRQGNRIWIQIAADQRQCHGGRFDRHMAAARFWRSGAFCLGCRILNRMIEETYVNKQCKQLWLPDWEVCVYNALGCKPNLHFYVLGSTLLSYSERWYQ